MTHGTSFLGYWLFGWFAYVDEETAHGLPWRTRASSLASLRSSPSRDWGEPTPDGARVIAEFDRKYPRR